MDQERLAAIVLDAANSGTTLEDGLACIEKFRREERDLMRSALKAEIRLAEREGRIEDALGLMRQMQEMEQEERSLQ